MKADKCLGLDGLNHGFTVASRPCVVIRVFKNVAIGLKLAHPLLSLDLTHMTLILKGDSRALMKDWRHIALCSVIYKLVAKVLLIDLKASLINAY